MNKVVAYYGCVKGYLTNPRGWTIFLRLHEIGDDCYLINYADHQQKDVPKIILDVLGLDHSTPCSLCTLFMPAKQAKAEGHYMTHRLTIYPCQKGVVDALSIL